MGLFNIFKTPLHEKYGVLIGALRKYYQSLQITKVETSVFSMSTTRTREIDDLKITIFRGNAYNEHPQEYQNLNYNSCIFVKMTYSVHGEAIIIRNAFPKNGNQFMMFLSIIGAEVTKTASVIEVQQQEEEEKKKVEEEKILKERQRIQNLKLIRKDIEESKQKVLSKNQKIALVFYMLYLTEDSSSNKIRYCSILNASMHEFMYPIVDSSILNSFYRKVLYNNVISIRNKFAVDTFIFYCSYHPKHIKVFKDILSQWGFSEEEIDMFIKYPTAQNIIEKQKVEDKKITSLTIEQRAALLGLATSLCDRYCISEKNVGIKLILIDYKNALGLSKVQSDNAKNHQSWQDKDRYAKIIKTINLEEAYVQFIAICNLIVNSDKDNIFLDYAFDHALRSIGFSSEDIHAIYNDKHKYSNKDITYKYLYLLEEENKNTSSEEKLLFVESWPLLDFARKYGPKVTLGTCTNKNTGEQYKACSFTQEDGTRTYVSFFSKLGELTASEILARKEELKVGITKEGKYYLHNGNVKAWEDVDLGL